MNKPREFIACKRTEKSNWQYSEGSDEDNWAFDVTAPDGGYFLKLRLREVTTDEITVSREDWNTLVEHMDFEEFNRASALINKIEKKAKSIGRESLGGVMQVHEFFEGYLNVENAQKDFVADQVKAVEEDPAPFAVGALRAAVDFGTTDKNFLLGILIGFACSDPRVKFSLGNQ